MWEIWLDDILQVEYPLISKLLRDLVWGCDESKTLYGQGDDDSIQKICRNVTSNGLQKTGSIQE